MGNRPRPVLIVTMVLAALGAVTGFAGLAELLPAVAIKWLLLVSAVAIAVSGVYLQSIVTPLADPRAADGRHLVPTPPAKVPAWTPSGELDATRQDGGGIAPPKVVPAPTDGRSVDPPPPYMD